MDPSTDTPAAAAYASTVNDPCDDQCMVAINTLAVVVARPMPCAPSSMHAASLLAKPVRSPVPMCHDPWHLSTLVEHDGRATGIGRYDAVSMSWSMDGACVLLTLMTARAEHRRGKSVQPAGTGQGHATG